MKQWLSWRTISVLSISVLLIFTASAFLVSAAQPKGQKRYYKLYGKASAKMEAGKYEKAVKLWERVVALSPENPGALYSLACGQARSDHAEEAFASLDAALEFGASWPESTRDDEDLESLREDPRFDRLIERMDEMLGSPSVDPHGDPIPPPGELLVERDHPNLLACPLAAEIRIARVTDQRAEFLQLLERHRLMPGRHATVESRDDLAETVDVRPREGERLRLGFPAASRILVEMN